MSVTTNGSWDMTSEKVGLLGINRDISLSPCLLIHNCVIHRQTLDTTRGEGYGKKKLLRYVLNLFNRDFTNIYYMELLPIMDRRRDIAY